MQNQINYCVSEVSDANSTRAGSMFSASSVTQACSIAERKRVFRGTVLKLYSESGVLLAVKQGRCWESVSE